MLGSLWCCRGTDLIGESFPLIHGDARRKGKKSFQRDVSESGVDRQPWKLERVPLESGKGRVSNGAAFPVRGVGPEILRVRQVIEEISREDVVIERKDVRVHGSSGATTQLEKRAVRTGLSGAGARSRVAGEENAVVANGP